MVSPDESRSRSRSTPSLVPLKELMPLQPWRTPAPPFPGNLNKGQYVKVKDGSSSRVFWAPKASQSGANDYDHSEIIEIPYQGLFEFIDKCVINNLKRWTDRVLGQIFSLPKYDYYNTTFRR